MGSVYLLLAQATVDPSSGWAELLATYGPFAPFAALLLWLLRLLWQEGKEKEQEIRRLTETAMDKVIPLALEATDVLADAVDSLRELKDKQAEAARLTVLMEDLLRAIKELDTLEASGRENHLKGKF